MKKIMFNDKYGLTQAVLDGRKTMTRRLCKIQRPSLDYGIVFPVFESDPENSPLNYAYGWRNIKTGHFAGWNKPAYLPGDIVAISMSYEHVFYELHCGLPEECGTGAGWENKMFVKAEYMPYKIEITNVGMSLLQNISDDDCIKEGVYRLDSANGSGGIAYSFANASDKKHIGLYDTPREAFAVLIDKVSGKGTWERNSFVWVYEFKLFD